MKWRVDAPLLRALHTWRLVLQQRRRREARLAAAVDIQRRYGGTASGTQSDASKGNEGLSLERTPGSVYRTSFSPSGTFRFCPAESSSVAQSISVG